MCEHGLLHGWRRVRWKEGCGQASCVHLKRMYRCKDCQLAAAASAGASAPPGGACSGSRKRRREEEEE